MNALTCGFFFAFEEVFLATAPKFFAVPSGEQAAPGRPAKQLPGLWARSSTWALMVMLVYFALDGILPAASGPVALRMVSPVSAGGIVADRITKLVILLCCMFFVMKRIPAVREVCLRMKLVTAFPIVALLFSPVSQQPSRTISSALVLLGGTLLLYYIMSRYSPDEVFELLLILGFTMMIASIAVSLAVPEFGLDRMGGHDNAWKGVFSAKNYLGNIALFFLTATISYRPRTVWFRSLRWLQIICCLTAVAFSRAATAYLLTAIYFAFLIILRALHRLRKKDYLFLCFFLFVVVSIMTMVIVIWPEAIIQLLGKDPTLTGRTELWSAVWDSIVKRPLLGYGYQAFWLGLEGESYRVILAVGWLLSQAQSGFLDVLLENGFVGLVLVLLVFGFAFRDGLGCLLRSRNNAQLRLVEWYLAIVLLTMLYNLDESFLFEPKHFCSMLFLLACTGLKTEWMTVRNA